MINLYKDIEMFFENHTSQFADRNFFNETTYKNLLLEQDTGTVNVVVLNFVEHLLQNAEFYQLTNEEIEILKTKKAKSC